MASSFAFGGKQQIHEENLSRQSRQCFPLSGHHLKEYSVTRCTSIVCIYFMQWVLVYRDDGVQKYFPVIKIPIIEVKYYIMTLRLLKLIQNFPLLQGMFSENLDKQGIRYCKELLVKIVIDKYRSHFFKFWKILSHFSRGGVSL